MSENTYTGRYTDLMNALSGSDNMTRTFKIALNICNRLWDFLPR